MTRSGPRFPGLPTTVRRKDVAIVAGLAVLAATLVALSLGREPPPAYPVSELEPVDVGDRLHGPATVTLDASDGWVYFSFATASTVEPAGPPDWDIAFRRFHVMVNGGPGFAGAGAVADLGAVDFDGVVAAPDSGWVDRAARDSTNEAIARWYDYGFTSHLLTPQRRVYAIRTADGRYARLRFLSYYCEGGRPGCITFEYLYQGDGTRDFTRSPVVHVEADAPLGEASSPASGPGNLQRALDGRDGPARLILAPGTHILDPVAYADPTCGNCGDADEGASATLGARVSGVGLEIEGVHRDSVVIRTNAGYGLLFEDCEGCALRGVTVTDGIRDPDGRATSGAILVRRADVRLEDCAVRDNLGDPDVVADVVAGVAGIVGREGASLEVERCRIERNSWDGVVLYRDARATIRDNVVDGVDGTALASRGGGVGGGRGVGIGLTWNARAVVEGNLVRNYWKGIGIFVDARADVRYNVVEDILTWGIAYWAAGDGQPRATIRNNAIYRTGACGVMVAGSAEPDDARPGELTGNALVRTAGDPRYDSGEPYCTQRPLARESVPSAFAIADNLLHDNRQPGPAPTDPQLDRAGFADSAAPLLDALRGFAATRASRFVRDFGPAH